MAESRFGGFVAGVVMALLTPLLVASGASAAIGVPERVADINPGPSSSSPVTFTTAGRHVYFRAYEPVAGDELWRSDGTEAGTTRVADINPGAPGSIPGEMAALGDRLIFSAYDPSGGDELWRTNGAAAATVRLADIKPGGADSSPRSFLRLGDQILFRADDGSIGTEPWRTDGTAPGTAPVADINPGGSNGVGAFFFPVEFKGAALFQAFDPTPSVGFELFRSDLTEAGAKLVANIEVPGSSSPLELTPAGDWLYFTAERSDVGRELFRSDGQAASAGGTTELVDDIDGAATDSGLTGLTAFKRHVYFRVAQPGNGIELVRSTDAGDNTEIVADVNPIGDSSPQFLTPLGDWLYFTAVSGAFGRELWRSDGVPTPAGTTEMVKDINPGGSSPCAFPSLTPVGGLLFFCASDGTHGNELWRSDGTNAGTTMVADINPGGGSDPANLAAHGDTLYFSANDGSSGAELWALDTGAPETVVASGPLPGEHIADPTPKLRLSSPALDLDRFQCSNDGGAFYPCAGRAGSAAVGPFADGPRKLAVRAVDVHDNPDPTPEKLSFTVDTTAPKLRIAGKRLRFNRRGVAKLKLRCPGKELTGPCRGKLKLKTRKRVAFGGHKRKLKLAKARFKVPAGKQRRLKLKLNRRKRALLRSSGKARRAKATAKVRDGLRNTRRVRKNLKLRAR